MRTHALLVAVFLCLSVTALAQAPSQPPPAGLPPMGKAAPGSPNPHAAAPPSPWAELADYSITVKVPPKGDTGTWKIRAFADPADVVVDLDTPAAKGRTKGTIMLVGGQAIALKGYTAEKGYEVDPLDVAIINLKVLTRLLDAAAPGGPSSVKGKLAVNAREEKAAIIASTPSATATFRAPWALKGTVERVDAKTIAFRLELDVPAGEKPGERATWTFTGNAGGETKGRVLEDSTSLAGWTAYNLAPPDGARTHTTLKFGATKLDGPFATLKDLRAFLAKPAPAKPAGAK